MEAIYGRCNVCGKPATHRCKFCSRALCDEHIDRNLNVCPSCKRRIMGHDNRKI